jgi:flagellar biosynthesis/type III secretory pathway chaperone
MVRGCRAGEGLPAPGAIRDPEDMPAAALAREFELELLHLRQMAALLEEERRALLAGVPARLDAITAERLVQANALELYAQRRAALLGAQGFTADSTGLAACAAAAGESGFHLAATWRKVAEAASEVRDLNEENRRLMWKCLAAAADRAAPASGDGNPRPRSDPGSEQHDASALDRVLHGLFSGCAR